MEFSNDELKVIGEVQRYLLLHHRGILTLQDVVDGLVRKIALADVDRITPHCLALLPRDARPCFQVYFDRWAQADYREGLELDSGPELPGQDKDRLHPRERAIGERIIEYYRQFGDRTEPPEELAVPEVDLFWETLRGMKSEGGPTCKEDGCDQPRVRVSVFCARHHYERIEKKPAPDY